MSPAIHWPKDWPTGNASQLQPSLQGAFWTGRITCSDRDAFGEAGTLLISLGTPQGDDQASTTDLNVSNLQTHDFAAPKCAGKPNQQNSFIAQSRQIIGQRRDHLA